jgi:hypothetical protein
MRYQPKVAFFSGPDYRFGGAADDAFFPGLRISPNQSTTERLTEMAGAETGLQGIIHSLDHGRLAFVIRLMVVSGSVIALALAYLLMQFRGLSSLTGIDQAQVAREIARGNGFSTKNIRPLALQQLERSTGQIPLGNFPDTFNAPLNPLVNSLALRCFSGELSKKITGTSYVFAGDRLVAGVSVLFFLAAVAVNFFLASRLFDRRIAWLSAAFVLLADQFWQFSLSGLPQMLLLFLFSCAAWVLAVAIRARRDGRGTIGPLAVLGFFLGLMALTHPLTLWISAVVSVFCAFYFRGGVPRFLVPVIICLAMFSIWIVRDFQVTRTPFGISQFAWLGGLSLSESGWMRELEPDTIKVSVSEFRKRAQGEFIYQLGSLYSLLGGVIVAPLFFVSLLHRFKRDETEVFKWALLLMWLFAFTGAVLIGINRQNISANQIHILFGPLLTFYGLAYVLVCWKRIQLESPIFRTLFLTLLFVVTGLPTLFGFLPGNSPIQFPPYLPGFMQLSASWTKPNEIIASDMPWAVAWYSDRKSLWLPTKPKTLIEFYYMQTLGAPIAGIYLTPVSRDLGYASQISNGEYKEWLPLILPDPKALEHFPLGFVAGTADDQCLFFSDSPRWEAKK